MKRLVYGMFRKKIIFPSEKVVNEKAITENNDQKMSQKS
jgi:hypothetical protein